MMLAQDIRGLAIGDIVETGRLFAGLSDEPLSICVTDRTGNGDATKFSVTYFGVTLAFWEATIDNEEVTWLGL